MEFANPKKILNDNLQLNRRMVAADFGCGSGEWAMALSSILEDGKVYAIDLLEEPLSALRGKLKNKNIQNVEIVKADVEKTISRLLANSLDLVLMTNLLFQVKDKKEIFSEAYRVLKSGGKILIIDWLESAKIGPAEKISDKVIKNLAKSLGFKIINEFNAGNFHFGLILEK